jgi:DNA polymerase III sliding clamp (beta) subunit (PCNA family)
LEIDKNECEKAIKKVWIFTRDMNNFIQIDINDGMAKISSWKTDKWAWVTEIPVLFEWNPVSFWINGKYITDFIRTMDSENIVLNIVDNQKPLILQNKNNNNYICVIRPLIN